MDNTLKILIFGLFTLLLLNLSSCGNQESINIAVASNFEPTLKNISKKYKSIHQSEKITIISASSGILTNQILSNAPFDLFLSADSKKPQLIYHKLHLKTAPKIYAIGTLALWIPESSGNHCLEQLSQLKTLAIANPQTAPYGKIASNIVKQSQQKVEKIIHTSNATQAYIYTKDKLSEAGFVPYSLVVDETQGCLQLFHDQELKHSMILLNNKARDFFEYLQTAEIKEYIQLSGYQ